MDFLTLPGECGQRSPCPRHRQFLRTISKWKKAVFKEAQILAYYDLRIGPALHRELTANYVSAQNVFFPIQTSDDVHVL